MNKYLEEAVFIAQKAGRMLKENLGRSIHIEYKDNNLNLVTEMDKRAERMITEHLKRRFPAHNIIAEEGTRINQKSEFLWIIDPLDGTTNYAHRIPWFAVSIALHGKGDPLVGVIYNPSRDEMFTAISGEGAYLNGLPMRVSTREDVSSSLLCTGFPYYIREKPDRVINNMRKFLLKTGGVRRFGAAALDLAYVSAGIYDGFWEEGLKPWDTAAGILMVEEAGGRITNFKGENYKVSDDAIVASNGRIHNGMLEIISQSPIRRADGG